jgi:uncharacterized protein with von Willebrand factor type A (vWA) domain
MMIDSEEITLLLATDISTMSAGETLAAVALLDKYERQVRKEYLQLLEANPKAVAQHPRLQEELDRLRRLDLEDRQEVVSGPGS